MNNTPKSNSIWRVWGPFLLYWAEQLVAQIVACCVLVLMNSDKLASVFAVLSEVPTDEEISTVVVNMTTIMMEVVMENYVEITTFTALCTIPVMYIFFRKDRKQEIQNHVPVNLKAPAKKYIWIPFLGIALCMGFNCLILMTDLAFVSESYQKSSNLFYSASIFVEILGIGLIAPIAEELLFRGVIFKRFRETTGFKWAAIYSSFIFAMIHSNILQMIYTFVLGMFFAYVYEKYGSFKAPVILHMCVNIVSIVATELQILNLLYAVPIFMGITIVICAFVGAVMFIQIQKIKEKPATEKF